MLFRDQDQDEEIESQEALAPAYPNNIATASEAAQATGYAPDMGVNGAYYCESEKQDPPGISALPTPPSIVSNLASTDCTVASPMATMTISSDKSDKIDGASSSSSSSGSSSSSSSSLELSHRRVVAMLDEAADLLSRRFPEFFKPSSRCRPPHLNVDVLRDDLFASEFVQRLAARRLRRDVRCARGRSC